MASLDLLEIVNDATMDYSIVNPLAEELIDDLDCSDEIKAKLREEMPDDFTDAVKSCVSGVVLEVSIGDIEFDPEEWYKYWKEDNED